MIIFNVPSWYPSASNPIYGTFIKEQILMMAACKEDSHFVVSRWGQGQEEMLLWSREPFHSLRKLATRHPKQQSELAGNVTEYFTPAYTWSRKLLNGNIRGIIQANDENFKKTCEQLGKPDVIHCQASYPAALIGNYLSFKYRIPYVVTIRMSPFPFHEFLDKNGNIKHVIRRPLAAAGSLIATSTSLGERLKKMNFSRVAVCNNPVDTAYFFPNKTSANQKKMIAVGRLVDQKGFDILLKVMAELDQQYMLTIIGDGVEKNNLLALQQNLGLQGRVNFIGEQEREKVRDLIQQHDALILSSRHETFGNVLVEALACGIPVVATDCGGPSDIVNESVGILCEKENATALRDGIIELFAIEWNAEKIRNYAKAKFSPQRFTQQMFEIYQNAIENFDYKDNNRPLNVLNTQ